jgi:hypothetical protein
VDHIWTCSCCGRTFDTLPTDYAFTAPRNWFGLGGLALHFFAGGDDQLRLSDLRFEMFDF